MGLTGTPQSPREQKFGFAEQTVYGTAEADSAAFMEVDCEPLVVNRDVKLIEVQGAHGYRDRHANNIIVTGKACLPSFTVTTPIKREDLAIYLAAFFQAVTEGATTPFSKTFTLHQTQPDFLSSAGYFYTWIARDVAASKSVKVKDCILRALTLKIAGGAEPAMLTAEWVGRGLAAVNANPSGTWTPNANTNIYLREDIDRVTVNFGAGAISFHLVEAELSFSRDIVGVGQDGSGQYRLVHTTNPIGNAKIKVVKDSDWETVRTNHAAGTAIDFNLGFGNVSPGTVAGDLDITGHALIDGPAGEELAQDEPLAGTINCHLVRATATEPITIIFADAVDHTW
jgi:hypothetical protein